MSHSSTESLWYKQTPKAAFPALDKELEVDVAVVGGGVAGITIGYVLKQSGLKVAVLEKNTIIPLPAAPQLVQPAK
jgi:ribulose 1,5-bisphosphate synthetase/thiazole synthase